MARPPLSFAVVGVDFENARGPTRRFEIAVCLPGERVALRREPKNPADPRAIAVYSARNIQIGYIRAEQAQWVGTVLESIHAVFQRSDKFGAVIRATFDGSAPVLTPEMISGTRRQATRPEVNWPPAEPEDDFAEIDWNTWADDAYRNS